MFGADDLALALGAAKMVPKVWGALASLFNKKVPETVIEAGGMIEDIAESIKEGQVSPEQQVELKRLLLQNKQIEEQVKYEREKLIYDDQAGGREVIKTALSSDDVYVRRTRPKILRWLFGVSAIYTFFAPSIYIAACSLGVSENKLKILVEILTWIGGFLFTSFTTAFTGYTVARSIDKRGGPNTLKGIMGFAGKLIPR